MYGEDDLLPISALQHLRFCRRRCALVHIEGLWAENRFTAEGNLLHRRVHDEHDSTENGISVSRGLRLASLRLGLFGVADVVEFHPRDTDGFPAIPFPVEYKRGRRKPEHAYRVQLCAQAICLEEMLRVEIPAGALYFGQSRRRLTIEFDAALRDETDRLAAELHKLIESAKTPPPERGPKCKSCSMQNLCLPHGIVRRSAANYVARSVSLILKEPDHEKT